MKDARGNELMQKNNKLYKLDAIDYIDVLKKNIKSLVNSKSNKKEIIEEALKSSKIINEIFEGDRYYLNSSHYNENTFMIEFFLKQFLFI
jgi:hypothetical protein